MTCPDCAVFWYGLLRYKSPVGSAILTLELCYAASQILLNATSLSISFWPAGVKSSNDLKVFFFFSFSITFLLTCLRYREWDFKGKRATFSGLVISGLVIYCSLCHDIPDSFTVTFREPVATRTHSTQSRRLFLTTVIQIIKLCAVREHCGLARPTVPIRIRSKTGRYTRGFEKMFSNIPLFLFLVADKKYFAETKAPLLSLKLFNSRVPPPPPLPFLRPPKTL